MTQKIRTLFLVLSLLVTSILPAVSASAVDAACGELASDKGQIKQTVHITETGKYVLWLRMLAPNASADSVYIQINNACVVVAGDSHNGDGFVWVNYREGDAAKKLEFDLSAGETTVTIAGREVGTGLDKVMFVSGACQPTDMGDNCLAATTPSVVAEDNAQNTTDTKATASQNGTRAVHWWILVLGIVVALAAAGLLVWRYITCAKRHGLWSNNLQQGSDGGMVVGVTPASPRLLQKIKLFIGHHKIFVSICGVVIIAALATGVAFAADNKPVFEAESAAATGGVKIVDDANASGGKYVVFEATSTPVAKSGSGSSQSGGTGSGTGSTGDGTSGGDTGNSGGDNSSGNPYPDRYSVGAPGVGHYAQSDASLPVPAGYTQYSPSDGTSNAYNMYSCSGTTNIDKAYFHAFIYVGTGCHGTINITNSIIAPPSGSNQRAILVNANNSASLTINISDTTIRPEPVPLGGTNDALTDHVLNDCETCSIHMNRVDVANSGGMCLCGKDTVIEHSWLHDSYIAHLSDPSLAHTGGVFPYGGSGPLEIKYNRLEPGVNAATGAEVPNYWKAITAVLFTQSAGGSMLRNYNVHHNFISLGGFDMGLENGEDLSIHDNVFGPNHFGYITTCSSGCSASIGTWTNNVLGNIDGTPSTTPLSKPF